MSSTKFNQIEGFIPLETARHQLALIWFIGSGLFLLLLAGQTLGTVYKGHTQELWSWALPAFMPTLGLIVSVLAASAIMQAGSEDRDICVRLFFFTLSRGISLFYLGMLIISALIVPIVASSRDDFSAVLGLGLTNYWLSPLQSIVVVIIGTLFFTKEKKSAPDANLPADSATPSPRPGE